MVGNLTKSVDVEVRTRVLVVGKRVHIVVVAVVLIRRALRVGWKVSVV